MDDADLCSTLGRDEQITVSWPGPGVLAPMLGDIYGTGSPPPATGVRGVLPPGEFGYFT